MKSLRAAAAILAIVPLVVCPVSVSVAADPPKVTSATGDATRIQLVFDRAVVALGAVDPSGAAPAWLRMEAEAAVRWRWAGASTLVDQPVEPLPSAATLECRAELQNGSTPDAERQSALLPEGDGERSRSSRPATNSINEKLGIELASGQRGGNECHRSPLRRRRTSACRPAKDGRQRNISWQGRLAM